MNLYIALLSDTFSRVYARALANAVMQQAHIILLIEQSLSKKKKIKFGHYMKNECGPLEVYSRDEETSSADHESQMLEKAVHHVYVRIDELEDKLKGGFNRRRAEDGSWAGGTYGKNRYSGGGGGDDVGGGGGGGYGGDGPGSGVINFSQFNHFMNTQNRQLGMVQQEVNEIKQLIFQLLKPPTSFLNISSQLPRPPDSDKLTQPHLLGATQRVLSMESSQTYPPGTSNQQQQQPFVSQGQNFFETRQPRDGQNQHSDSRSRLPYNYPQSDSMRSQRIELVENQDPISSYSLPSVQYTAEADC